MLSYPDCYVTCTDGTIKKVVQESEPTKDGPNCHPYESFAQDSKKLCEKNGGVKSSDCILRH